LDEISSSQSSKSTLKMFTTRFSYRSPARVQNPRPKQPLVATNRRQFAVGSHMKKHTNPEFLKKVAQKNEEFPEEGLVQHLE
jgi:hypothetical protein